MMTLFFKQFYNFPQDCIKLKMYVKRELGWFNSHKEVTVSISIWILTFEITEFSVFGQD